ncbi:hypothetical protein M0813_10156 [Anaeramoeba flamelloides]|uniref:Uncharacterized protein n=1 Tax=Anaeramoeba flamelloides TaxID=1746091 RepID=A0ABQ8X3K8_9EUKA|nr:hypothetical protein M0813_10156 [Anaeramoeba flamelloides]
MDQPNQVFDNTKRIQTQETRGLQEHKELKELRAQENSRNSIDTKNTGSSGVKKFKEFNAISKETQNIIKKASRSLYRNISEQIVLPNLLIDNRFGGYGFLDSSLNHCKPIISIFNFNNQKKLAANGNTNKNNKPRKD